MTDENQQTGGKFRFDPTINLGHLITFIGFVIGIAAAYNTLDKRISVAEVQIAAQSTKNIDQDHALQQAIVDMATSQRRIETKLDALLLQEADRGRANK